MSNAERAAPEPIAIIGIGSRFPGAPDADELWKAIREGRDCTINFPGGRSAELEAFYGEAGAAGRPPTRRGGFLRDVDAFDADFFQISPREAEWMDPQQRLLLEVAWEAIENAGQSLEMLRGSKTGVFVGIWTNDYEIHANANSPTTDFFNVTGAVPYAASGRIAYQFDLRGPDLSVNAACAASLVAVHLAVRSLRSGESSMALAGGVNLIFRHEETQAFNHAGMLAKDGHCKFGDARADGIVRSEGAGIVVLKRLSDAQRDGDSIFGLIVGTAVANSGRASGSLTLPSGAGERQVMLAAIADAGISPGSIQYVEAHGTGSRAGDPVELAAIASVFGGADRASEPCLVGSVKSNIGHAESAAGVAGIIKTVHALRHGMFPPTLHVEQPNPAIEWASSGIALAREASIWERPANSPRRAAVNGLALAGTNAHVVLEEAPKAVSVDTTPRASYLLPMSATSEAALRERAQSIVGKLKVLATGRDPDSGLRDLCYTAAVRRTHLSSRLAVVGADATQIRSRLEEYLFGEGSPFVNTGFAGVVRERKVAFVFPGQGSQWIGMGRELLRTEPVFRAAMEACDREIQRQAGWSVLDQLQDEAADGRWTRIDVVQPVLFAMQVALAALWKSWGLVPSVVIGHSMGEVAAAHVAGILSLEDAVTVICRRSALMMRVAGTGAMAVVDLSRKEAEQAIAGFDRRVSIAVSNSQQSTVLSGDPDAIDEVIERLESLEVFCRRVRVDVASHSPQMDPLKEELRVGLRSLKPQAGSLPLCSTVRGSMIRGEEMDAAYWVSNLRDTVQFAGATELLLGAGCDTFVEISPHPILLPFIEQTGVLNGVDVLAVGSTRREEPETQAMLHALGNLYTHGAEVGWKGLYPAGNLVTLPAYPWQRERFWIESVGVAPALRETPQALTPLSEVAVVERESKPVPFFATWKELAVRERGEAMTRWIREQVAAVVRAKVERIAVDQALKSHGVNSLMALELRNRIERGLGIALSAGTAWNYPTVAALAEYLNGRLAAQEENGEREKKKTVSDARADGRSAADLLEAELSGAEMLLDKQRV
jgi:acyl transferase domain-containing protein